MKQKLLWLLLGFAIAAQGAELGAGTNYPPELKPDQAEARAAHLAVELLSRYHYKAVPLDETLSGKIFDQYLKALDPEKLFFVQSDVDHLSDDRNKLGDAMRKEDLAIAFAMFNLYEHRSVERFTFARTLLQKGFDFDKNENYQYSRDKGEWPQSEGDANELWRQRVKNDWLRLKLAGKDDKSIVEILDKRYEHVLKRMGRIKSADAFQTYMNAYTTAIEPHTNYLSPRAAADFDIAMKLSLVGIGAVLSEIDEYTTIREVVAGGPASLSGQLKIGDRIVGVAQGNDGVMTDVMGWRLDDTVELIRGSADSVVRLDVLPAGAGLDGRHKLVSLIRKPISMKEQSAKSSVQSIIEGNITHRIGVISLSSFYEDFSARQNGDPNYKNATRDVTRLLEELKTEKVDGVLVDLRNNGGGSLLQAIELTSLFVGKGPVVQQRNASGEISVERGTRTDVAWDGPLGILINRGSASASEIFAAAIQDYGRGLILGGPSFGKGTVQTMIDLDQIAKSSKPQFGELKMTVAQFFRVNGGTTQLRGVKPDIRFPEVFDEDDFGESSYDNALPWVQIKATDYSPVGDFERLLPILLTMHEARVENDQDFRSLQEDIAELKLQRKKNLVSLNEAQRRKERDALEARLKSRTSQTNSAIVSSGDVPGKADVRESGSVPEDDGLQADERTLSKELANEKVRKDAKDVLLMEAVHVLGDEVEALKTSVKLAARPKPASLSMPD